MNNILFYLPVLTGAIFSLTGWIIMTFPPKSINKLYGYRTPSSTKSQERWNFAQHYSAKEFVRMGIILMLISPIGIILNLGNTINRLIAFSLLIIVVIALIIRTERAIKKRFANK